MDMDIENFLKDYLNYLEIEKNRSIKTRVNYERYLKRFFGFSKISEPIQISQDLVRQYRLWLNRQGVKKNTQNYYLIALRNFLKYLAKRDVEVLSADKIELGKQSERQVTFLESDEIERLLAASQGPSLKSLRDRAILELLFSTGLRVSELCSLDRDSFNLKSEEFPVRGKGDKIRLVFVSGAAKNALKNYLEKRQDIDPALFVRHAKNLRQWPASLKLQRGERGSLKAANKAENLRLTPRSVERLIKYYAAKAGIGKRVTPHTMRHSFATDLLLNGADIRSVQELLGHSNITTTQVYTHITDKQLREVHEAFHGKRRK